MTAGLPGSIIEELANEVRLRRDEQEASKPLSQRIAAAMAATKRARTNWTLAKLAYQLAEQNFVSATNILMEAAAEERAQEHHEDSPAHHHPPHA